MFRHVRKFIGEILRGNSYEKFLREVPYNGHVAEKNTIRRVILYEKYVFSHIFISLCSILKFGSRQLSARLEFIAFLDKL